MEENKKYFSICIPVYNRAKLIIRTLESLERQSYKNFEVLVIDDGSKDELENVIKEYKKKTLLDLKYFYKDNGGKHTALNLGIEKANSKFFIILDSDDYFLDDTLKNFYELCRKIENNPKFSGIMGRCIDMKTGELIGELFEKDPFISSYIDFHYKIGLSKQFGDCCECNKTSILKKYHFPENEETKFIPEAWLFDQIGLNYKLYCTNRIFKIVEYTANGITLDNNYKLKNNIGFLYHYTSRIENILPYINPSLRLKIIMWWRYWESVKLDKSHKGPRVKKISLIGYFVKTVSPFISIVYKIFYKKLYMQGR